MDKRLHYFRGNPSIYIPLLADEFSQIVIAHKREIEDILGDFKFSSRQDDADVFQLA